MKLSTFRCQPVDQLMEWLKKEIWKRLMQSFVQYFVEYLFLDLMERLSNLQLMDLVVDSRVLELKDEWEEWNLSSLVLNYFHCQETLALQVELLFLLFHCYSHLEL